MSEFFTWEYLLTFAGCVAGTGVITEFVKNIPGINKIPNQIVSYFFAFLILVVAQFATGIFTLDLLALDVFNAAVVSFASNGVYDAVDNIKEAATGK